MFRGLLWSGGDGLFFGGIKIYGVGFGETWFHFNNMEQGGRGRDFRKDRSTYTDISSPFPTPTSVAVLASHDSWYLLPFLITPYVDRAHK
jgi:hypothetical protein